METVTERKQGMKNWVVLGFPCCSACSEDASCAQTADMQINPRVNAEALSRAYGSKLLARDQREHGGGHARVRHHGGRPLLPATEMYV